MIVIALFLVIFIVIPTIIGVANTLLFVPAWADDVAAVRRKYADILGCLPEAVTFKASAWFAYRRGFWSTVEITVLLTLAGLPIWWIFGGQLTFAIRRTSVPT